MGLGKYLKKAFLFHWNLLAFAGSMGFALLSGHPDVFVPLVLAGEVAYVGLVGTNARFQRSVDVREHQEERAQGAVRAAEAMERMLRTLPPAQLRRFEALRERCRSLREIAQHLRTSEEFGGASSPVVLDDLQLSGLDRLLWIYLRLLFTQTMLERFFERTSRSQIENEIARLEERLSRLPSAEAAGSSPRQVMRKAIEDNLETCRARLANYQKAKENSELLQAEIERLENKINSINEMAVNRQDPQYVSGQVDAVADSLVQTEQTINDLSFATGLDPFDDAIPALMPRGPATDSIPKPAGKEAERRPRPRQTEDGIQYD